MRYGLNKKILIILAIIILVIGGRIISKRNNSSSKYDGFAVCLKEKGAVFYGTFWCPHCQNQKKLFGSSQKLLPYVECSTPDGQSQTFACKEKGIEGYPTWIFSNGERATGEMTLASLAEKTGCVLP